RSAAVSGHLALLERVALRTLRPGVPHAHPQSVLVQLAAGRVRDLPWLRAHHRHRLRTGHSRRDPLAARRRHQALADQVLQRMPAGPGEVREAAGHSPRHTVARASRRGTRELSDAARGPAGLFRPRAVQWSADTTAGLPGLSIHDLMLLPIERGREFFDRLTLPQPLDEATELLLVEIRGRFRYLVDVGLGYLTLDRQSRTLSGGE